jgi:hypothetical protein
LLETHLKERPESVIASFTQRLSLLMIAVVLFSVLTMEPEYVRGYKYDDFPVLVESDDVPQVQVFRKKPGPF